MKVTLLAYTPQPEHLVASAAKLCYSASDIDAIGQGLTDEKVASFVDMLAQIGHESPIEHASFSFGIEGVSRSLLAQLTRHRIASYSVQSQRYVQENMFEFVLPTRDLVSGQRGIFARHGGGSAPLRQFNRLLAQSHKQRLMQEGMEEKQAEKKAQKQAIEDARFVLPNACATKMVCTMNARSLHNFFAHRCCNRAQWEIRELATQMLRLVLQVAPHLFGNAGPACLTGACPEGKMSCGKCNEVREKFRRLRGEEA